MKSVYVDNLSHIRLTEGLIHFNFAAESGIDIDMSMNQMLVLQRTLNAFIQQLKDNNVLPNGEKPLEERYNPGIFSVPNEEAAKQIILTHESTAASDERWEKETPALISLMKNAWDLHSGVTIVDYGCGIGRISKELCKYGCTVIGVDISPEMRKLAVQYVDDPRFFVISPEDFVKLLGDGFTCDYACTIWVLQHCLHPNVELDNICKALRQNGELFVVNNKYSRAVPVSDTVWAHDDVDIWKLCSERLQEQCVVPYPEGLGMDPEQFQYGFYKKTT